MPGLKLALLGPPQISVYGKILKTDRRKAFALLVYLAVTAKSHTRDYLAGLLWPGYGRDGAYAYLRRAIWELNQILGKGWIHVEEDRVAIQPGVEISLDTTAFDELGRSSDILSLEEAVALYRGDFLEGFVLVDTAPFEGWQFQQTEYYRRSFSEVLEKLVKAHAAVGDHTAALSYARRWLALDQLNETAQRAMMHLLAEMGDRTGAIRQYELCVQALKSEFGIPPQPETTKLYESILTETAHAETSKVSEPLATAKSMPALHLPVLPTPFIGRQTEVAQIKTMLADPAHRLVTLIGPGGIGKTRLSIQAASEMADAFPDGVFFAPLAVAQTSEAILPILAKALGFSFYRDQTPHQQMMDHLREKRLLIVLDNFEHLLESVDLVSDILTTAPEVKLLVTSRARLNINGEQLYPVSGMHIPELDAAVEWQDFETQSQPFSAIQLFLNRARLVRPDFNLTKDNVEDVLKICDLAQGMPLALEIAAAWLELLTPAEIAHEISRSLDFLETSQADVPDRQRSIRAVFESSWKLLNEEEQRVVQVLCVFVGSFSREAAQDVSDASLRVLLGLANKSWLQPLDGGRYQLHDLLRHYGLEQFRKRKFDWKNAHDRHAAYFTAFATEQNARMKSSEQFSGTRAFEQEYSTNMKAAWDWSMAEGHWKDILLIADCLLQFAHIQNRMAEFLPWMQTARQKLQDAIADEEILAYAVIGIFEVYIEEYDQIKDFNSLPRVSAIWDFVIDHNLVEKLDLWFVLLASVVCAHNLDPRGDALLEEAITRIQELNDQWKWGITLLLLAHRWGLYELDEEKLLQAAEVFKDLGVWYEQGLVAELLSRHAIMNKRPLATVLEHLNRAKAFFAQQGNEMRVLLNSTHLADMYFREGKIEQGFAIHHETQAAIAKIGNQRMMGANLHWEALHAMRYSTFEHALDIQQRSLTLIKKLEIQSDYYWGLYELGEIYRVFGQLELATPLYAEALVGFEKLNMTLGLAYSQRACGDLAIQSEQYSKALRHYERCVELAERENHPWSIAQAHTKQALALAFTGDLTSARKIIEPTLVDIRVWGEDELVFHALLVELVCLNLEKQFEKAIALAALINNHPVAWQEIKKLAQVILEDAARNQPEESIQAAVQQGRAMNLTAIVNEILMRSFDD